MRGRRILGLMTTGVLAATGYWLNLRPWHLSWGADRRRGRHAATGDEIAPGVLQLRLKTVAWSCYANWVPPCRHR